MKGLSIKGIILGLLADLIIDMTFGIGLALFFPKLVSHPYTNTGLLIYAMFLGTISTMIGGFVAAKIGNTAPYNNALAFGVIGVISGFFLSSGYPTWFNVFAFVTTIPAALVGAYFIARQNL